MNSMKYLVNWIPLRIRVRLRDTQPYLIVLGIHFREVHDYLRDFQMLS
jgi:hypothetical protein